MLGKIFRNEELIKDKEEKARQKQLDKKIKEEKKAREREEKEEREREREERLAKENSYILNKIIEEIQNPGTHGTTISHAINTEVTRYSILSSRARAVEDWVNSIIRHRSQIINLTVREVSPYQEDQGPLIEYSLTYWDVLLPYNWEDEV